MEILEKLLARAKANPQRIVLPEGITAVSLFRQLLDSPAKFHNVVLHVEQHLI